MHCLQPIKMKLPEQLEQVLEPELIQAIESRSKLITLKEGDVLLEIGQPVKHIPLVIKGSVKISRLDDEGRELLLYHINPNESCAMTFTCCMQQYPSEVKAVAEDEVTFFAIPISVMDEWLVKYPSWKSFVMRSIRTRFNELIKMIDQITFQKLDERLINYLKEKAKNSGSALINLSHQQIADELATSRVVISRLLKKLENDKKVLLYRHQVKVLSGL